MSKIDPTVGRVVWFHPPANNSNPAFGAASVCAALIASVLPNGRLNLGVLDGNGALHSMTDVPLIQEGDEPLQNGYYAEWMPYQKAVAKGETAPVLHAQPTKAEVLSAPAREPSPFSAAAHPVTTPPVYGVQNPAITSVNPPTGHPAPAIPGSSGVLISPPVG